MNVEDLTAGQRRLLTHARAMGGWLAAVYVERWADDMYEMTDRTSPPLFQFETGGGPDRYGLTSAGYDVAWHLSRELS